MRKRRSSWLDSLTRVLICFLVLLVGWLGVYPKLSSAQTVTRTGGTRVTAGVPDIIKPSAPILISPDNHGQINIAFPDFIWIGSTDNVEVAYYRLWVDGSIMFDLIDPSSVVNGVFTIKPLHALADGQHFWQVEAVDTSGNSSFSATWYFTIDTLAPAFGIDQIGQLPVEFTAPADLTDSGLLIIHTNSPVLQGTGEPGTQVKLIITLPDGQTIVIDFVIGPDGIWTTQLPQLPENATISLSFIIQDAAGNISMIQNLQFTIIASPKTDGSSPPLVFQTITDQTSKMASAVTSFRSYAKSRLPNLGHAEYLMLLIWLIITLMIGLAYLTNRLGKKPNFRQIKEFLWILRWWPIHARWLGLVYEMTEQLRFANARISIYLINNQEFAQEVDRKLSNQHGRYQLTDLEPGKYQISVQHPAGLFPCLEKKPKHGHWQNFYQSEKFEIKEKETLPVVGIPLTLIEKNGKRLKTKPAKSVECGSWTGPVVWMINLPISILITLIWPHWTNLILLLVILTATGWKKYHKITG